MDCMKSFYLLARNVFHLEFMHETTRKLHKTQFTLFWHVFKNHGKNYSHRKNRKCIINQD